MPNIEVRDLVQVYDGETRALDGITFEMAPGELFGFLGPNGAGNTTPIRYGRLPSRPRARSPTAPRHAHLLQSERDEAPSAERTG